MISAHAKESSHSLFGDGWGVVTVNCFPCSWESYINKCLVVIKGELFASIDDRDCGLESIFLGEYQVWSSVFSLAIASVVLEDGVSHSISGEEVISQGELMLHHEEVGFSFELIFFSESNSVDSEAAKNCEDGESFHFVINYK